MLIVICSIRDNAVEAFGTPTFGVALGQVTRSFTDEINRPGSELGAHPEDYELFEIGRFDTETGKMLPLDAPRRVMRGLDVVKNPS